MKRIFLYLKERLFRLPVMLSFSLGVIIGISAVCILGDDFLSSEQRVPKGHEVREKGYTFISPLLECETQGEGWTGKELRPFKYKIQDLVDEKIKNGRATHISVYFRDLNNGPWFGINEKEEFSPASLLKVPIMMAYLNLAESDPNLLSKKLKYEKGYDVNLTENIRPSKAIERGRTYTVEELLHMMIAHSDNNAKDLLLGNIDVRKFEQTFLDLGIEIPGIRKPEDFMSVKAYASFFRVLYNASYLSKGMSEKALEFLSKVDFKNGLVAGVPKNITVAHKFGERRIIGREDIKQLHDCGIIYYPDRPYLLCVMTRGKDFDMLIDNVRDISYLVYDEIESQRGK